MKIIDSLPKEFFITDAKSLHLLFPEPTLIRLKGRDERCVFISTLLHGDETTGLRVLQEVLATETLPCSVLVLIGNPQAARLGVRRLSDEIDQNRIWSGQNLAKTPWAQELLTKVLSHNPIVAIDIHNTSGKTKPYSVISYLNGEHVFLGSLFDPMIVHFREPNTTLVSGMGQHLPAVVVECGPSTDDTDNKSKCVRFVRQVLNLQNIQTRSLVDPSLQLFESYARVFVRGQVGFGDASCALNLNPDLDSYNMSLTPASTVWGTIRAGAEFVVQDAHMNDITNEFFDLSQGQLLVRKPFVPSLITTSVKAAKDDCLCYLMKSFGGTT